MTPTLEEMREHLKDCSKCPKDRSNCKLKMIFTYCVDNQLTMEELEEKVCNNDPSVPEEILHYFIKPVMVIEITPQKKDSFWDKFLLHTIIATSICCLLLAIFLLFFK